MNRFSQIVVGLSLLLALSGPASAGPAAEPAGFWTGPMRGQTPASLAGANVIDAKALAALIASDRPLLIDVAAEEAKPAGMAPDALWLPIHRSVPGSVWMPGAGDGALTPPQDALLTAQVDALTAGAKAKPVVVFCHRDCWASWNAAKRLVRQGYLRVYWFPDGVEGWQDAYEAGVIKQDPEWAARPR